MEAHHPHHVTHKKKWTEYLLLVLVLISCNRHAFNSQLLQKTAPEVFTARFVTTKGTFEIEAHRSWSPNAVDRLYQLIKSRYYTNVPVYRVVPNYVVQWGGADTALNKKWEQYKIPDEPVVMSNTKGMMAFARSGPESRRYTLFVNLKDNNPRLDTLTGTSGVKGYPPVAKVIKGFDILPTFFCYDWKNEMAPKLDTAKNIPAVIKKEFPKLDYIKRAYLVR